MVIVNGEKENKVFIDDSFYFGRGIFETIMIFEKPLFLKEHINRINEGAKSLGIKNRIEEKYLLEEIKKNNINNCVLKVVLTDKNIVLTTRKNTYTKEMYDKGFNVTISDVKRNSTSILSYIKSVNYIENILEKNKAKQQCLDEVIFLNEKDILCEGSCSNLFFVKQGQIFTPKIECGLLNGTIRKWIIDNFNVIEGEFHLQDLLNADEVFFTNSVMGIMKINSIQNGKSSNTTMNKIYTQNGIINKIYNRYEIYVKRHGGNNND
ncbi:aminotransferase class IV [Haloimpatiens sp. FM7330]|uniref:aminotransferase class IV n=1 Tax=Haloimpatiens sp. FM7330 TaxID=3298610 RepID=UPI00363C5855